MTASSISVANSASTMLREVARHTGVVFLSTLAIQTATFAILALAAYMLSVEAFARLSVIVAATILANALFDLGLNITATKLYGDTQDAAYLRAAFAVRLALVPVGLAFWPGLALTTNAGDIGLGIALGALLNVWNGVRASDQARQDYASFTRSSLAFALLRAGAGLAAVLGWRSPVVIAICIYAVPVIASVLSTSAPLARQAFARALKPLVGFSGYAVYVYLNALTFIAIPYVPQFVVAARLDATAVGTYGLMLTFTAPISLLVYSLRSVLLPKMLGSASAFEDMLWSWRGAAAICVLWVVLMAGGGVLAYVLDTFYGNKFPDILPVFLMFFAGYSGAAMIGLYSLSVHTLGVPRLGMLVGVAKLLLLILLLAIAGSTLTAVVLATAAMMVLGEVALISSLAAMRRS